MATRQRDESRLRSLLTQECARIMADEGVKDFLTAKRKAATRLRIANKALLPGNAEIEQALLEYQRLFKSTTQPIQLQALRKTAWKAMQFLARFQPRLVGPVLTGTAYSHANINLHVFADTSEDVLLFLLEHNIPVETGERRLRFGNGEYVYLPVVSFSAGETTVELTIFKCEMGREAPRSPVDGKPMHRADLGELDALLEQDRHAE